MISSNFKGKNLTDIYDLNVNEIFKRCGIHIPSQKNQHNNQYQKVQQ